MPPTSLLLAAILAAGAAPDPHHAEIEAWRAQRVERLKVPDGWLSLVGLDWIEPGRTAIGSAVDASAVGPDADAYVKIAGVPPRLGTLTLADGKLSIALEAGTGATVDGKPATQATLLADDSGTPSVVATMMLRMCGICVVEHGVMSPPKGWGTAAAARGSIAIWMRRCWT